MGTYLPELLSTFYDPSCVQKKQNCVVRGDDHDWNARFAENLSVHRNWELQSVYAEIGSSNQCAQKFESPNRKLLGLRLDPASQENFVTDGEIQQLGLRLLTIFRGFDPCC